ncbi:polyprenyl synthetase family protein [Oceanobacillus alkalisoli]|uniref:polyprenyl synthetase family protein n=1 Tax=Oceanobacillus alkalisoli TaxID=2925113 RepID=UPI001EF047ED|nr:polyprenyl synthetase family protein [Oceanobacillus alkalisoli]MCF3943602.1 polyprenyl synthetase family protein [Oceanobacillus alkalisoli]MCG5105404.1 polyprenyl synthetase family protein [Oceanobacillus alkalisoli]
MNDETSINREKSFLIHEKRAGEYFRKLSSYLDSEKYITNLGNDFKLWEKQHSGKHLALEWMKRRKSNPSLADYNRYIKWLGDTEQLDHYLDRSVSYIFMRDLGKSFEDQDTLDKITSTKTFLKKKMKQNEPGLFRTEALYHLAKKEGIEHSFIWLVERWDRIHAKLPKGMDGLEAQRKLMKLIAGVLMHQLDMLPEDVPQDERKEALDQAIRLGYSYGLTYPFIDDLLDSNLLNEEDKKQYTAFIRETLLTGEVPDITGWIGSNQSFIRMIHSELKSGFEYIKGHQPQALRERFFEQAYVFFEAQEKDRAKQLENRHYSNEDIYISIILKSAFSRLIVRSIIGAPVDDGFDERTFYYGIYNQLADDFTDLFADLESGAVTPYTYYLTYHTERDDLLNPFELYWAVISYLLHEVYGSEERVREALLSRAINSQKRFRNRADKATYENVMKVFAPKDPTFWEYVQKLTKRIDDVDFLDKLIRDHMIGNYKQEEKEKQEFVGKVKELRTMIDEILQVEETNQLTEASKVGIPIVEAANYSLESGGKRLRPILTAFMGTEAFGLEQNALIPLLKSLEYMHTASLIFDDLPAQDNASVRRGHPTLHKVYNTATAELTGLYLTQQAVFEQASLDGFDAGNILKLIQYSSGIITEMCKGQAMDLAAAGKKVTLEQLETICFYKTGLAFEASLVMPAILAGKNDEVISFLKKYSYHTGIAFQIKDDLLDAESDVETLGKPAGQDMENETSTFVTVLGVENAKKAMWDHYTLAAETLNKANLKTNFLTHFLNYTIKRTN